MKSLLRAFTIVAAAVLISSTTTLAQDDLSATLNKIGKENVQNYLAPILAGWSSDLNTGFYHSADLHDILGFDIGVKVGLSAVQDADKAMDFTMPDQINYKLPSGASVTLLANRDYNKVTSGASTAVGAKSGKDIAILNSSPYYPVLGNKVLLTTPDGFDIPAVPLFAPQLAIGLPLGFEVIARFIPTTKLGDYGKVGFTGFGLRYDVDQWLPAFPVDIAVHFMTQSFKLNDNNDKEVLSASATSYGLEVSKRLFILTLYTGFDLQSSSFTVGAIDGNINANGVTTPYHLDSFTIDGKNKSRFVVGVRLLLLIINVHAEYSFATTPVATLGVGLSIR